MNVYWISCYQNEPNDILSQRYRETNCGVCDGGRIRNLVQQLYRLTVAC